MTGSSEADMPVYISDEEIEGLINDFSSLVVDVSRIANALERIADFYESVQVNDGEDEDE